MLAVRNCWYVAAWSTELPGEALISRTILGELIMLYRAGDGAVVGMEDRCCHRLAPLSLGERDGDAIRCMYHGFKFDRSGRCIEIPGQDMIPPKARVKTYPVLERGGWIWIWMGDATRADAALLPQAIGPDNPEWNMRYSQLDYEANYQLINDNLTDFSHLAYVHRNSFGASEDFSRSRPKVIRIERGIHVEPGRAGIKPGSWTAARLRTAGRNTIISFLASFSCVWLRIRLERRKRAMGSAPGG